MFKYWLGSGRACGESREKGKSEARVGLNKEQSHLSAGDRLCKLVCVEAPDDVVEETVTASISDIEAMDSV